MPHRGFSGAIIREVRRARIQYTAPLTLPGQGLPLISILFQWLTNNSDSLFFRQCIDALIDNPIFGIPSKRSKKPERLREREKALLKITKLWEHIANKRTNNLWEALQLEKSNDGLYSKLFSAFERVRSLNDSQDDPAGFIAEVVNTFRPWKKTQYLLNEIDSWVEISERINDTASSGVQLTTLQKAKGLEADVVCVIGLQEGTLPRVNSSPESIAEQSRLMYVSMTRAKGELHLFHARKRSGDVIFKQIYKKGSPPDIQPSRFINSIPSIHKENIYHPS